jgi:heterodisulfide reductase subunit A2
MESNSVCIIGAGVSGMTTAVDLANAGLSVDLLDQAPHPGGRAAWYGCKATDECVQCGVCLVRNGIAQLDLYPSIKQHYSTKLRDVRFTETDDYVVSVERQPNAIDRSTCTNCGKCVESCSKNAVVRVKGWGYYIDSSCDECGSCIDACAVDAIDFERTSEISEITATDVIVATGFTPFDPATNRKWGYGENSRIITGTDLERLFHDEAYIPGNPDSRIAFVQCVGSRNVVEGQSACSRVCCAYSLRMANRISVEHPDIHIDLYYMDLQNFGRDFDTFIEDLGKRINLIRSNPISVTADTEGRPIVRYESFPELSVLEADYDYVVLSHGIASANDNADIAEMFALHLDTSGFIRLPGLTDDVFAPNRNDGGVLLAGSVTGPLGIAECAERAHEAAGVIASRHGVPLRNVAVDAPLAMNDHTVAKTIAYPNRALVIGDGFAGTMTALNLSSSTQVDLVSTCGTFYSPGDLAISLSTPDLQSELTATINRTNTIERLTADAILRSTTTSEGVDINLPSECRRYGVVICAAEHHERVHPDDGLMTLNEVYRAIDENRRFAGTTCFILDYHKETDANIFDDALYASLFISKQTRGEVLILHRQAHVSGDRGEALYDECREAGIVFIKYGKGIRIEQEDGDFALYGTDELSGTKFSIIKPDSVIMPGLLEFDRATQRIYDDLHIRTSEDAYAQPESLWLLPNDTNRAFVLTAGSTRTAMGGSGVVHDAVNAALTGLSMLRDGTVGERIAEIDEKICARCLTCVRSCPAGAIHKISGNGKKSVECLGAICTGCGICASVCPAGAIEIRNADASSIDSSENRTAGTLVVHCGESGRLAVERMREDGRDIPDSVSFFEFPCSGRINEKLLLGLFESDYTNVLVVGCRKGNCKHLDGNLHGEKKVARMQDLLRTAGINEIRTEMLFVAPDEGKRLHTAIMNIHDGTGNGGDGNGEGNGTTRTQSS